MICYGNWVKLSSWTSQVSISDTGKPFAQAVMPWTVWRRTSWLEKQQVLEVARQMRNDKVVFHATSRSPNSIGLFHNYSSIFQHPFPVEVAQAPRSSVWSLIFPEFPNGETTDASLRALRPSLVTRCNLREKHSAQMKLYIELSQHLIVTYSDHFLKIGVLQLHLCALVSFPPNVIVDIIYYILPKRKTWKSWNCFALDIFSNFQ